MTATSRRRPPRPRGLRFHGPAGAGLALLAALCALALAAPLAAPFDPDEVLDAEAGRHLPPGSRRVLIRLSGGLPWLAEAARPTPQGLVVERLGRTVVLDPAEVANLDAGGAPESHTFWLGTDWGGRDLLSRLLFGARASLLIGVLAAALSLTLGLAVGAGAGLARGFVDGLLMRLVDAFMAFPRLFLVLLLSVLSGGSTWMVIVLLGCTGWMGVARLVRAEIVGLEKREFALAARASGQHPARVLLRHLLPNALAPVVVETSLQIGNLILVEAALSFLGFGVQPPTPSWGNIIADGSSVLLDAWWVTVFPGLAITLTVIAINLVGDGLRDALDPRQAGSGAAARAS